MDSPERLDPLLADVAIGESEPPTLGLRYLADRLRTPTAEISPLNCPSPEFQLVHQLNHGPVGRELAEHAEVAPTSGQPLGVGVLATSDEHSLSDYEGAACGRVLHHLPKLRGNAYRCRIYRRRGADVSFGSRYRSGVRARRAGRVGSRWLKRRSFIEGVQIGVKPLEGCTCGAWFQLGVSRSVGNARLADRPLGG